MEQKEFMSNPGQDETGIETEEAPTPAEENAPKKGFLLDEPDEPKVVKRVLRDRERQQPRMNNYRATTTRTKLWRQGQRHVRLDRSEDRWEARVPLGMRDAPPVPNKCDRICRRIANVIHADKPLPECEPATDSAEDKEAAETSTRLLRIETSPGSKLDLAQLARRATDKAGTFASAFAYFYPDPTSGGKVAKKVRAHKAAVEFVDELQVLIDPTTGQKGSDQDFVDKYVTPQGALTDNELEADQIWLVQIRRKLLTGNHVLFLPAASEGIVDARGVHLTIPTTLGDLKATFAAKFENMPDDEIKKIVDWRPEGFRDTIPEFLELNKTETDDGKPTDESLVCVMCEYWTECAEYPKGAYVCVAGETVLLHREEWSRVITTGNGKKKEETLWLPVAQYRSLDDNIGDDPLGIAIGEKIGPADELRASIYEYMLDHMWKSGNPHYFLPDGSIVQPGQLLLRNGDPIYVNPNGTPTWEQVAEFPAIGTELLNEMTTEINDESSLQETGQGGEVSSVTSGVQARAIIEEAQKGLTEVRDNALAGYLRSCQIVLQQMRAFYSQERLATYQGEDGRYKVKSWTGSDLGSTRDVKIARGSATMLSPSMKRELALEELQQGTIDPAEYAEISANAMNPILGTQDNPFLMKIRGEISTWRDGPAEGFNELAAAHEAFAMRQQQTAGVARAIGADPNVAGAMQPPPPLPSPFRRVPVDLEPVVATIRHRELARLMTTESFQKPKAEFELSPSAILMWQRILISEYQQMLAIVSMAQQQQAAAEEPKPKGKPPAKKPASKRAPARAGRR